VCSVSGLIFGWLFKNVQLLVKIIHLYSIISCQREKGVVDFPEISLESCITITFTISGIIYAYRRIATTDIIRHKLLAGKRH